MDKVTLGYIAQFAGILLVAGSVLGAPNLVKALILGGVAAWFVGQWLRKPKYTKS